MECETREVDIWRTSLDIDPERVDVLKSVLSSDECARAERYAFDIHRRRYIVSRAFMRQVLSGYCGASAQKIQFQYGVRGKPAIIATPELFFNLSHSESIAILAVTSIGEVGVDVERVVSRSEEKIAERFFAPAEVAALRRLPPEDQADGFFRCWTRKEAYIKARGEGLSIPLDSFEVSLRANDSKILLRAGDDSVEAAQWTVQDVAVPEGYQAAVAIRATGWQVRYRGDANFGNV